ncbi:MAG: hypothetical protein JO317_03090, partial [Verrucomicrobiae bacterium]|nr:hypothetical protein [Verrucomicrobiae bacterium]
VADVIYSRDPGLLRREVAKFLSTIAREDFGKVTTFVFDLLANGGVGSDYAVKKGDEGPK